MMLLHRLVLDEEICSYRANNQQGLSVHRSERSSDEYFETTELKSGFPLKTGLQKFTPANTLHKMV